MSTRLSVPTLSEAHWLFGVNQVFLGCGGFGIDLEAYKDLTPSRTQASQPVL